jgi:hypothetical protein
MSNSNQQSRVISSLIAVLAILIAGIVIISAYYLYQSNDLTRDQIRLERELSELRTQLSSQSQVESETVYVESFQDWRIARSTATKISSGEKTILQSEFEKSSNQLSCVDLRLQTSPTEMITPTAFNGQDILLRQALLKFIPESSIATLNSRIKNTLRNSASQDLFKLDKLCSGEELLLITRDISDEQILVIWKLSSNDSSSGYNLEFFNPIKIGSERLFKFREATIVGSSEVVIGENRQFFSLDYSSKALDLIESCTNGADERICSREVVDIN